MPGRQHHTAGLTGTLQSSRAVRVDHQVSEPPAQLAAGPRQLHAVDQGGAGVVAQQRDEDQSHHAVRYRPYRQTVVRIYTRHTGDDSCTNTMLWQCGGQWSLCTQPALQDTWGGFRLAESGQYGLQLAGTEGRLLLPVQTLSRLNTTLLQYKARCTEPTCCSQAASPAGRLCRCSGLHTDNSSTSNTIIVCSVEESSVNSKRPGHSPGGAGVRGHAVQVAPGPAQHR